MSSPDAGKPAVHRPDKAALAKRMARIQGQVRGIAEMIEADRYCVDVITQVQAARQALAAVADQLLEHHLRGCVSRAISQDHGDAAIEEVLQLLKKSR
ncbi:metal-sensitive transcriptional regulator [Parachitinimonas caeni]|uniref:Metal-sensitive transcriptional regulator n=1 Tax=Parachitinimonas caeni TaxID=3031301 RepID=A0ABT7DUF9_9NEIS|nr:metal-sensitive transcriptional regulator [Parachitinimonas caeni]MDK2123703.1 metal-sensitive transcriptional regulator [Parachitinimonas caeni]